MSPKTPPSAASTSPLRAWASAGVLGGGCSAASGATTDSVTGISLIARRSSVVRSAVHRRASRPPSLDLLSTGSDEQRCADEDLAAVGAVGVPSPVRIPFDPEPVMDLGVVPFAHEPGVLQRRLAAVEPVDEMMDVAPVRRGRAAGEHAVPVPLFDRPADVRWHDPL